jgi:hypothetical protein
MAAVGLPARRSHDAQRLILSAGNYISLSYKDVVHGPDIRQPCSLHPVIQLLEEERADERA